MFLEDMVARASRAYAVYQAADVVGSAVEAAKVRHVAGLDVGCFEAKRSV
jgi:hypothetical protein